MEWVYWASREGAIQSRLGHIQITRPGYFERGFSDPFSFLMPMNDPMIDVVRHLPEVKVVAPRIEFTGLISHGDQTISFLGEGVAPKLEAKVSKDMVMVRGSQLMSSDDQKVILGQGLAATLGADVGDSVVLLATKPRGGLNAVEVTIGGVFHTESKSYDDYALRVPLVLAQRLINVAGVHSWVLLLRDTGQTDSVLKKLRAQFADNGAGPVEFTPWYKLADYYKNVVALLSRQMNVLRAMIAIIVVLSISNTMIANVFERTGEIGTLCALGYRRRRIVGLFVGEGLLLGVIGGTLGVVVGWLAAQVISTIGIPMPPAPGMTFGFNAKILLTPMLAGGSFLLIATTTVIASLYPAWRASRLMIVDALRHNR